MDIRWLFFDIGGTLINEDAVWRRRFEEQARRAGRPGLTADVIRREVEADAMAGTPSYHPFLERYQLSPVPYRKELEEPYADALPVLQKLSQRYRLGVIDNQSAGLQERLRHWGMLSFLQLVVSSYDHGICKPDVRLFEIALKEAGCSPEESVMIGDRIDNDILPAKQLGMGTVHILQGFGALYKPAFSAEMPDNSIGNLSQLLQLF